LAKKHGTSSRPVSFVASRKQIFIEGVAHALKEK